MSEKVRVRIWVDETTWQSFKEESRKTGITLEALAGNVLEEYHLREIESSHQILSDDHVDKIVSTVQNKINEAVEKLTDN